METGSLPLRQAMAGDRVENASCCKCYPRVPVLLSRKARRRGCDLADTANEIATAESRAARLSASPAIFSSRLLDFFTRVHVVVPPLIYIPLGALLIYWARGLGLWGVVGWTFAGYALWTLMEYWIHRTVFHWEPEGALGARVHWLIHGIHHDHPSDPLRLVFPPAVSIPTFFLVYGILSIVLDGAVLNAVAAGIVLGYVIYDLTHFYLHHFTPRTALGRALRARHMHHHFRDDTAGYGVSAPWWDAVFGTAVKKKR
jgi:dihydroceramide fatty acyl 2-hydroxylase